MGCICSKNGRPQKENSVDKNYNLGGGDQGVTSQNFLSCFEAACQADPQLQKLDTSIRQRSRSAIKSMAEGVDCGKLSLETLRDVAKSLLAMDRDAAITILKSKKYIRKNPELYHLVDEFFHNSERSLAFYVALDDCLNRALDSHSRIILALEKFDEDHAKAEGTSNQYYSGTLEELRNFRDADQAFTKELFSLFEEVCIEQRSTLDKLIDHVKNLTKRSDRKKTWNKVTGAILLTAFASVLICSVVVAAVAAPPLVTAMLAAAEAALAAPVGKWSVSVWTKFEKELNEQLDILVSMSAKTDKTVIKELETTKVLMERVQIEIERLTKTADFALNEEDALEIAVKEIKKKVDVFRKTIQDLSDHADKCRRDIDEMRIDILAKSLKCDSSSIWECDCFACF